MMVRNFHRCIGDETLRQIRERAGRLPDQLVACVGGGSNAIGFFFPFLDEPGVKLVGVEAGGEGTGAGQRHAARFATGGRLGVLQGTKTYILADDDGQIDLTHSVSAGLDYAAIGPEHSHLRDIGRVTYASATDEEALSAFHTLAECEGIIPALETAHAIAHAIRVAPNLPRETILVVNLSGRGDKDVQQIMAREAAQPDRAARVA